MKKLIIKTLIMAVLLFVLSGCGQSNDQQVQNQAEDNQQNTEQQNEETSTASASSFATWHDESVEFTPQVPEYSINTDLSNVKFTDIIDAPDSAFDLLAQNGFAVTEGWNNEFFTLYEGNRYENIPSFITTDSVLHTYHLYFDFLLKSLEENQLYDLAHDLSRDMQKASLDQYNRLKGTEWEASAKRNVGYFTLPAVILDPEKVEIPDLVSDEVKAELELIKAHKGIDVSLVFGDTNYREDYSQYIPRGHYNKSEQLQKYFKALMWYGRMTFRLDKEDEVRSSLLMMAALNENNDSFLKWRHLYEPIGFFVGEADDLVFPDFDPVMKEVYGDNYTTDSVTQDSSKVETFIEKAKLLRDPGINSIPILGTALQPEQGVEERKEETKGYRFLGQRFTIDAFIFQKLICREVGNKDGTMPCPQEDSRMLPNGLDIPSAFGSELAYKLLSEMGETDYAKYPENMNKLKNAISQLPESQWTHNAYWGWLYTLTSLLDKYGKGYPTFMQNDEWKKKELNTFLGSYAELKHDTILYAKQVYAELGGGPMIEERDDRGYVEPNPELYARLASLTLLTKDGLNDRNILSEKNAEELQKLYDMLIILRDVSVKELENKSLTDDEYEFIRTYGGSLEHFWTETFTEEEQDQPNLLDNNPAPIIADIATDPNCCVLEIGTGPIEPIYVIFPIDGELHVGKGGVYSYYEFTWPMNDRLTDEKWRDEILIDSSKKPDRPSWETFISTYE